MTLLLNRIGDGDSRAPEELLPLVYGELRSLAGRIFEHPQNHTLQPTALVHEAYLKLLGPAHQGKPWDNKRHFMAVAATAMRQILTDYARGAARLKRGGAAGERVTLSGIQLKGSENDLEMLDLHGALTELEQVNPRIARVVELRYLGGMTVVEVALELGITERAVYKDWRAGRALLMRHMAGEETE